MRIPIATHALSMMWSSVADDNEAVDSSDEWRRQCIDDSYCIIRPRSKQQRR